MGCRPTALHQSSGWAIRQAHLPQTRSPAEWLEQTADAGCRQTEERNMHANIRKLLMAAALIVVAPSAFANVITDWNENAVTLVTPRMAPGAGQRVVAIMQLAMFDAVNSIERRYRPYLVQLPAAATTSKEAAATAAAGIVLASLIPQVQGQGQVKGMTTSYLASLPDSDAKAA